MSVSYGRLSASFAIADGIRMAGVVVRQRQFRAEEVAAPYRNKEHNKPQWWDGGSHGTRVAWGLGQSGVELELGLHTMPT